VAEEHEHPIAGIAFLLVVATGIFFLAKSGIESSREEHKRETIRTAMHIAEAGDLPRASEMLQALAKQNPGSASALFFWASVEAEAEHYDLADQLYVRTLEIEPDDWEAMAERGWIALKRGDVDAALEMMMKIPGGKGHLEERMQDAEWMALRSDSRLQPLLDKHHISNDSTLRPPKEPNP